MTLDYGNYGIILIMGNAGFISSIVGPSGKYPCHRVAVKQSWRCKAFGVRGFMSRAL